MVYWMHTSNLTNQGNRIKLHYIFLRDSSMQKQQRAHAHDWKCCPLRALSQAILNIIVHTDIQFDRSFVRLIVLEFYKINKHHNLQNVIGYVVSITLLRVKVHYCG